MIAIGNRSFATLPVPRGDGKSDSSYNLVEIDFSDSRYFEPLVDVAEGGIACDAYYAREDGLNQPYHRRLTGSLPQVLVRTSVRDRLHTVEGLLRPYGARLLVLDGFRTPTLQRALWDFFVSQVRAQCPDASPTTVEARARRYCSDPRLFNPSDPRTWPSHVTGAAVDLTLIDIESRAALDMGGAFDDVGAHSHTDHYESTAENTTAPGQFARRNRRILYNAMISAGFTNYWPEWWHFDFGDQLWAKTMSNLGTRTSAFYGLPPGIDELVFRAAS